MEEKFGNPDSCTNVILIVDFFSYVTFWLEKFEDGWIINIFDLFLNVVIIHGYVLMFDLYW